MRVRVLLNGNALNRYRRLLHPPLPDGGLDGNSLRRALSEHAEELREKARDAEDTDARAAYEVLAAVARGEDPPKDAAKRLVNSGS